MEQELKCPFCGRNDFKSKEGFTLHIKYCKSNPDRVDSPNKDKPKSEETKRKMSEYQKKRYEDPEERRKTHEAGKKRWEDPELRQKRSELSKKQWENPEARKKLTEANKGRKHTQEERRKMSEATKQHWKDPEFRQKRYNTMKQNNTFNTSKIEIELQEWFKSQNIDFLTEYTSKQYPTRCDFYLPKYDLYIEIQGHPTHGKEPFNPDNPEHIKLLDELKSKATSDNMYNNMINVWTIRDPKKRETAKINNLNWIEIFSIDLEECINVIQKHI